MVGKAGSPATAPTLSTIWAVVPCPQQDCRGLSTHQAPHLTIMPDIRAEQAEVCGNRERGTWPWETVGQWGWGWGHLHEPPVHRHKAAVSLWLL